MQFSVFPNCPAVYFSLFPESALPLPALINDETCAWVRSWTLVSLQPPPITTGVICHLLCWQAMAAVARSLPGWGDRMAAGHHRQKKGPIIQSEAASSKKIQKGLSIWFCMAKYKVTYLKNITWMWSAKGWTGTWQLHCRTEPKVLVTVLGDTDSVLGRLQKQQNAVCCQCKTEMAVLLWCKLLVHLHLECCMEVQSLHHRTGLGELGQAHRGWDWECEREQRGTDEVYRSTRLQIKIKEHSPKITAQEKVELVQLWKFN